ncbi:MAG: SH3 domain-containing protein [Devosia sp.]
MTTSRLLLTLIAGVAALGLSAGGAYAASARASDPIPIYDSPGGSRLPIGRLVRGEVVQLDRCTPRGVWCRVIHNGPTGWVLASYLIGSAAKMEATPGRSLVNPLRDPLFLPGLKRP